MTRDVRPWRIAAAAVTAVIVVFGVLPTHETLQAVAGEGEGMATVVGHFLEYLVLGLVLTLALRSEPPRLPVMLVAGLLCVGLGVAIELIQLALPYRSAQMSDVAVNAAGAAVGLLLVSLVGRTGARRSRLRPG